MAVALGSVFRVKGGMALGSVASNAARALLAAGCVMTGVHHIWVLHALTLLANASGLAFIPHVSVRALSISTCHHSQACYHLPYTDPVPKAPLCAISWSRLVQMM